MNLLLLPILIPLLAALIILLIPKKVCCAVETLALLATAGNLLVTYWLFGQKLVFNFPWAGNGLEFSLRLYHFSAFTIAAAATFGLLIAVYCLSFLKEKEYAKAFWFYLLVTLSFVNGAVLANNLVLLLFFWEGLLLTLFGMILIGGKNSFRTAIKAFIINGITDLCLMVGIALTGYLAGTLTISSIHLSARAARRPSPLHLLMIGAISKAGSMPFHTWIPDAALDAPLPFMALLPGCDGKTAGHLFPGQDLAGYIHVLSAGFMVELHADDDRRANDNSRGDDGAGPEELQETTLLPRHQPGRLHDPGDRHDGPGRDSRRAVPHDQQCDVQMLSLPDRRRGGKSRPARPTSNNWAASGVKCR